ncbi:helix-turn-helix transcriptional regulator [Lacticaseibacillus paracasei]|uniref:helix-turn-helix transcriptional regulator n=1 Tax=Lacticaseibacillus paracasei TaxID=1597 RepID=UPI0021A3A630|nr:helix-turn-helix transcriptional regulator [Lacticaseibacillus paracasei]UWP76165.1 helix-turn-helix transcriptional regulator [Lacticaseibacillus paracasei]
MLNRENKIELNDAGATSAADMIKEILDNFHITQVDFAERIGISQKHLSKVLNHKAFISTRVAKSIELVTGTPAKLLLRLDTNYRLMNTTEPSKNEKPAQPNYLKRYDWVTIHSESKANN